MLDTGETDSDQTATVDSEAQDPATADTRRHNRHTRLRRIATACGLLGTLLALAVPFLPVTYQQVDLHWPTAQGTRAVSAPLTGYQPISVDATVPCTTITGLAARTGSTGGAPGKTAVVFATVPPGSVNAPLTGLTVSVPGGQPGSHRPGNQLSVLDNGRQLVTTDLPTGATAASACALTVRSTGTATTVTLGGHVLADVRSDIRPQVTGIYSDLTAADQLRGLAVDIQPDNRFQMGATALKVGAMILAVLALVGAGIAVHKLDVRATGHGLRFAPRGWWKPTLLDGAVLLVLLTWWLIGAGTSDDGYILTMARDEAENGYIGNIYRWFNSPEAPFGWFYELYARWVRVSTLIPWTRLPAMLMGLLSWLMISREALPRLGPAVRRSRAAAWGAAGAFLAFWLPYDNGLRPESVVVLWTLAAMCLVERTIATKRLLPLAAALFAAAFAVAATPTGLIALAPLLAAARPLLRLFRERVGQFGWLAVLTPLTAAGTIVLLAVFANQTARSVIDSTKIREAIGPAESWYQETDRYRFLFSMTADGSLERRFPVLLIIFCLITCTAVLLRRGRIPGAALGPSQRLIGTTILSFAVLALTPTKWTHHFGAFAALGGSIAALTALATSASVLRSWRNRLVFTAGLLIVTAVAFTGPNAWFYSAKWGTPWDNIPPVIGGHSIATGLLALAVLVLLVAGVVHLRGPRPPATPPSWRRRLRFASAPLALVCAVVVAFQMASFGKEMIKQGPAYSVGKDNFAQLTGNSCGVADYTLVEPHPLSDVLSPLPHSATRVPADAPVLTGFHANGFPAGTDVNIGQRFWMPEFGAGPNKVFAWGNVGAGPGSQLRTQWYPLPARAHDNRALLVVDVGGTLGGGNTVVAEFGRQAPGGFQVTDRATLNQSLGSPNWREAKLPLPGFAAHADAVRLVATASGAADGDNWIGVSAPRVPTLVDMTTLIGDRPTFVEWTSAQGYPCLRPFGSTNGISELPQYWWSAGEAIADSGWQWSGPAYGGPMGWMNVASEARPLPTYLVHDINRDAGTLYQIVPVVPDALPATSAERITEVTRWGWYSPGPTSVPITNIGVPPSSPSPGGAPSG